MRKTILPILAAAALLVIPCCVSCNPPENNENGDDNGNTNITEPEKETPKPGTYKFTAPPLKGKWEAGDKIYVHGSYGPKAEIITLTAGDISSDGLTASGQLDPVTEFPCQPDGLYAAWPADCVEASDGLQSTITTFTDCMKHLGVAYLKGDTFQFADASSAIKFKVSGFDRFIIASNTREGMGFTGYDVDYSSQTKDFDATRNDGYPFREQATVSGDNVVWFPGNISFSEGYTLYMGQGDAWPYVYKVDAKTDIQAGNVLDLGDITSKLTAYNGPAPKIPRMVKRTKYTVKFNELSGIWLGEDKSFLWGVGDNGDLAKLSLEGEVLYSFHIGGDTEDVTINPATGDLLIALEPDGVGVVKAPDFNTKVSTLFSIKAAKNYGNAGMEGLTYYKDGKVYAGAQSNSHLFLCDLASGEVVWEKKMYDKKLVSEIAGLCYDPLTDWLWIIDSESRKMFIFSGDTEQYYGSYSVAGISNPESLHVDHTHSCVWVGDDAGSTSYLYRFDFTGLDDFNIQ